MQEEIREYAVYIINISSVTGAITLGKRVIQVHYKKNGGSQELPPMRYDMQCPLLTFCLQLSMFQGSQSRNPLCNQLQV